MPLSLPLPRLCAALDDAAGRLLDAAVAAGLDARVPSCPAWDTRALLAHQAMVHRWATAHLLGTDPAAVPNQTTIRSTVEDLPAWFAEGWHALTDALAAAPPDLRAMTFLADAPPPREFWARRQTHETTIHLVDALGARRGRVPTAAELEVAPDVAADGIDELLRGFFTRGRSKLFDGREYTLAVVPTDTDRTWVVRVAARLEVDPEGTPPPDDAEIVLSGTTSALYVGLWNRGDEFAVAGDPAFLTRWRSAHRVRWS